jgi:hypothetical protein
MNGDQPSGTRQEDKPSRSGDTATSASEITDSKVKRKTIRIKLPPKPAAPVSSAVRAIAIPMHPPQAPARAHDLPLRIASFAVVTLLVLAYCHFFFEYVRLLPLCDFLPVILWPQVIHKLLGVSILAGFAFFERERKALSTRARWIYCSLLASGIALFAVQWIIRW